MECLTGFSARRKEDTGEVGVGLRDVSRQGSQPSPSLLEPSGQIWLSERKKRSDWPHTKGMEGSELLSAGHILTASRSSVCVRGG